MSKPEQRRQERYVIDRQPDAQLALRTAAAHYPIKEIRDVSNSGISIAVDRPIPISSQVAIEYVDASIRLDVYGTVIWQMPAPADDQGQPGQGYILGIELLSPMMLAALLQRH